MSLARTNSPLSKLIIRNIGDSGGPRADHVDAELDNLIAWAKLSPRCIHRDTAAVGTVTTGLDNLHSFSLPANSLAADGDYLRCRYAGFFAANDNNKRTSISFDGQVVQQTGLLDIDSGQWTYDVLYVRVSATSVRASVMLMWRFIFADGASAVAGNGLAETATNTVTVSNLNSNAVTLLVQGESDETAGAGTGTNSVVQNLSIIELCQQ